MPTIDERLDRLTERHEALIRTIKLTAHKNREQHASFMELAAVVAERAAAINKRVGQIAPPDAEAPQSS